MKVGDKLYYYSEYKNTIEELVIKSIYKEETKQGCKVVAINGKDPNAGYETSPEKLVEKLIEQEREWMNEKVTHYKSLLKK